jgi:CheY-like chemotaxis protein
LLRLVALHGGITVQGVAGDEEGAVSLITASNPDAVLLDLALAPGSGIHVLQRIRQAGCTARVLVVTNNTVEVLRRSCEALGISGFYDKSRDVEACMDKLFGWLTPSTADDAPPAISPDKPEQVSGRPTNNPPRPSAVRFQGARP